ncbi:MAG TPA: lytic murein transglycosylase, partial [Thalassospira sp.]|nr:lytic murein transglycosylase [Thalassospira sp.]
MAQASFRKISICALALGLSILIPGSYQVQAATNEDSVLQTQPPSPLYSAVSRARLNAFLDAVEDGKTDTFKQLLTNFDDPLLQKAAEWMLLTAPNSGHSFEEITAFIDAHPKWPSQALLRQRAEEAMTDAVPDDEILA